MPLCTAMISALLLKGTGEGVDDDALTHQLGLGDNRLTRAVQTLASRVLYGKAMGRLRNNGVTTRPPQSAVCPSSV
ncbi:hypothetical protein HBO38_32920 [Pseudomonas veronii]|uniref:Uncharacterized protein n=1 Tax=Pseudomonas veronii TaxID=76761 RepID=A0A7Y1FCR2_PSEVE|nr:hypothetical protein [Pseudomonas veronii]NMY13159.1 hypothetical protein [Pseudomonas veronii]